MENFHFSEWAVDGDYGDGCLVGTEEASSEGGFYYSKNLYDWLAWVNNLVIFIGPN